MRLVTVVLGLLSVLGNTAGFTVDTRVTRGNEQVILDGTSCDVWVKHGSNRAYKRNGVPDNSRTDWFFRNSDHVSLDVATYIWTSCWNALLIDFAFLSNTDEFKTWGSDNEYAWCLSRDSDDAAALNDQVSWNPVISGCYSTLRMNPSRSVSGWSGFIPTFWQHRRMLADAEAANLPSANDVNACLADPARPEEECDALVEQIFSFEIEHSEGFTRAAEFPIDEEELELPSDVNTESATEVRRLLRSNIP